MNPFLRRLALGLACAGAFAATSSYAFAEEKVGSTVESRVLLGFKVSDEAVNDFLPKGWVSFTLPKGPISGANLIVVLIDRHLILDAEGSPASPSSGPTVALLAYARKDGVDGVRGYVVRVYEETPVVDPYGNSVPADIDRVAGYADAGNGNRMQSELWTVRTEGDGLIKLDLDFKVGGYSWSIGGESRPYSSKNADFHRIYRYDQLAGLAMSAGMERALDGSVDFTSSDPEVAPLFDGSEELVSILSIPIFVREISLP